MTSSTTTTVRIAGYAFDLSPLENRSGVYAILDRRPQLSLAAPPDPEFFILDIGESHDVRGRVFGGHERADCWARHTSGTCVAAAYYCDEPTRMAIEQTIRDAFPGIPCGKR